ncbi:MAG TPA: class I SAM-dependent methyltransferase [Candidatus Angelobacter sp.]|jgi:SAM-dependent methyltransferase|nr:class I SAM-dependent methyltransferase [Candidatus Angelobacter sp.]
MARTPAVLRALLAPRTLGAVARRRAGVRRFSDLRIRGAFCTVCGGITAVVFRGGSARESWMCVRCRASNRQRQLAAVLCERDLAGHPHRSLVDYASHSGESIYIAEQRGPLHAALQRARAFAASEYVDPQATPGSVVDGVMHQDLQRLSFDKGSFDLVVTTDVLEHVPDPYAAHGEILRVLRPGGRHVFTVPYDEGRDDDEVRAAVDGEGNLRHLAEPQYHLDPLREEGALVFTIFGRGMASRLRDLGFEVTVHRPDRPSQGIFGPGAVVFEASKPR